MNVLDLFSGIGGFSLGLERAGMRTVAFCEIEPYCQAVLRKHWPDVPCFEDIRTLTRADIAETVDVICGGFPCQDISFQGFRAGLTGERSGLWTELARLVGEFQPKYVLVENVSALLFFEFEQVLRDLAALGFDAEWECVPASYLGACHHRDRLWLVAYPQEKHDPAGECERVPKINFRTALSRGAAGGTSLCKHEGKATTTLGGEPALCRTDDGLSHGLVQRQLSGYGNAVVPQVVEQIGRAIMESEGKT